MKILFVQLPLQDPNWRERPGQHTPGRRLPRRLCRVAGASCQTRRLGASSDARRRRLRIGQRRRRGHRRRAAPELVCLHPLRSGTSNAACIVAERCPRSPPPATRIVAGGPEVVTRDEAHLRPAPPSTPSSRARARKPSAELHFGRHPPLQAPGQVATPPRRAVDLASCPQPLPRRDTGRSTRTGPSTSRPCAAAP